MGGDSQQQNRQSSKRVAIRLVRQTNEEETYDDVTVSGNNLMRTHNSPSEQLDVVIDLSVDGDEMKPGVEVRELGGKRGSIREIVTGIVAVLLIVLVTLWNGISKETGVTIFLAILFYYFGWKSGQRR
jgi:hypothetical protein